MGSRTAVFLLCFAPAGIQAQRDSAARLEPVVVTVTRGTEASVLRSPFAITILQPDSSRPGQRHTSVDETLAMVPGLAATSRNNPAQDPRLSIRGFGARSAFGVRGVRVLRDGMPLTLPDGQTPLDYLSLESVGRIEVLRGAASALYGNASGGVIDFHSIVPAAAPISLGARQWLGSSSMARSVLTTSGRAASSAYAGDLEYTRSDGSRAHSRQRATSGFARTTVSAGHTEYALSVLALDNPLSENPGALTIDEMNADPGQADLLSVRRNARKAVKQFQLGLSATHRLPRGSLFVSGYGGARSLDNPLTFGIVEIGRHSYGGSTAVRNEATVFGIRHSLSAGLDYQSLNDLRRNYATCADTVPLSKPTASCPFPGEERGIVTLDQRELVSSLGIYARDDVPIGDRVNFTGALRGDRVRFSVRDRLVTDTNADDSGRRTLGALSPIAGLVARISRLQSLYANISAAFETPTATELGNHADGSAGINPDLNPQRSTTTEAGAKGWLSDVVRYDVALYDTRVRDELVPFEIPGSNGRRYFRNAGRTSRRGAEAGADVSRGPVSLMLSYTWSRFRFERYISGASDFSGNTIPGISSNRLQAAVRVGGSSSFALLETEAGGKVFADDANTVRAPGYVVSSIRAGASRSREDANFTITVGIQNIFDRVYASSIAVNAARGKFYEPAQRRTLYAGLSIETAPR